MPKKNINSKVMYMINSLMGTFNIDNDTDMLNIIVKLVYDSEIRPSNLTLEGFISNYAQERCTVSMACSVGASLKKDYTKMAKLKGVKSGEIQRQALIEWLDNEKRKLQNRNP